MRPQSLEELAIRRRDRLATFHVQCNARVALHTTDEHFEMKMRTCRQAGHADIAYRRPDSHSRAGSDSLRESAKMAISGDEPVAMPDVDRVAVATLATGKDHDSVADGSNWSSHRRRVARALMLAPDSENRVPASTENTGDASECNGGT